METWQVVMNIVLAAFMGRMFGWPGAAGVFCGALLFVWLKG